MCTSMPWWMLWSWSVRIISRPVRSPTCASRGYLWPPKLRWRMRPSAVRSKSAPQASSSRTRSGASLRVQLGHAPVVHVLAAAHRVGEVHLPAVAVVHVAQRGGDAALGHHRVRLAEERLAHEPDLDARRRRGDRRPQPGAAGADDQDVVVEGLIVSHRDRSEDPPVGPDPHRAEPDVEVGEGDGEEAGPGPAHVRAVEAARAVVGAPCGPGSGRAGRGTRRPRGASSDSRACSRRAASRSRRAPASRRRCPSSFWPVDGIGEPERLVHVVERAPPGRAARRTGSSGGRSGG